MTIDPRSRQAVVLGLVANILWGTSFIAAKYAVNLGGPLVTTSLAFGVALAVLYFTSIFGGSPLTFPARGRALKATLLIGVTGFGFFYPLLYAGLGLISSGYSAAILLSSPLFTLLLAAVFLGEKITWRKSFAIAVGLAGCLVLLLPEVPRDTSFQWSSLRGELFTFGAALSLAVSVILTRKYADSIVAHDLTFWSILAGLIFLLPLSAAGLGASLSSGVLVQASSRGPLLAIFYLGAVCTALCCFLWNRAIILAPAKVVAPTMYIKTPVAILIGALFAREALSLGLFVGTGLVLFGIWISETESR
jgi:drug/metabolite transporter (DMT)-like permease